MNWDVTTPLPLASCESAELEGTINRALLLPNYFIFILDMLPNTGQYLWTTAAKYGTSASFPRRYGSPRSIAMVPGIATSDLW
jgi:hypothetical protein